MAPFSPPIEYLLDILITFVELVVGVPMFLFVVLAVIGLPDGSNNHRR